MSLEELVRIAKESQTKRSRFLVHRNHSEQPQIMIIYLERGSVVGRHRHPTEKTELYLVLEGRLSVEYLENGGVETQSRVLAPWGNPEGLPSISVHRDSVWHEPKALSEYVLYLEVYSGPFEKTQDVEYLV